MLPHTHIWQAQFALRCGAKPVFVDVDLNGNMNFKEIKTKVRKTKAIIYVHLYGYFQNIDALKIIKNKKFS